MRQAHPRKGRQYINKYGDDAIVGVTGKYPRAPRFYAIYGGTHLLLDGGQLRLLLQESHLLGLLGIHLGLRLRPLCLRLLQATVSISRMHGSTP